MLTEIELEVYCEHCKNISHWEFRQCTDEKGRLLAMVIGTCKTCQDYSHYESWETIQIPVRRDSCMREIDHVIEFALKYAGSDYFVTSIDSYWYEDSDEHLWCCCLVRRGKTKRINITKVDGAFQARWVEMSRYPGPWPRRKQKEYLKDIP